MPHPQLEVAERIGGALTDAGLARLPSRVFAALLVDDDGRMTSAELATFLGVSPAGISGAIGYLAPLGLVRRERERGSRRDIYVVDDDAWYEGMMRHRIYDPIKAALESAIQTLGPDAPAHHRLTLNREFLVFLEGEFDSIATRWEDRKKHLDA